MSQSAVALSKLVCLQQSFKMLVADVKHLVHIIVFSEKILCDAVWIVLFCARIQEIIITIRSQLTWSVLQQPSLQTMLKSRMCSDWS